MSRHSDFTHALLAVVVGLLAVGCTQKSDDSVASKRERGKKQTADPIPAPSGHPELNEQKQQFIWDSEHITFEIETYVGRPLAKAVSTQDSDGILQHLTESFSAEWLIDHEPNSISKSGISQQTWEVDRSGQEAVSRTDFPECMLRVPAAIAVPQGSGLRVLHISQAAEEASGNRWNLDVLLTATGTTGDGQSVQYLQTAGIQCEFESDDDIRAGRVITSWNVTSESLRIGETFMEEVTTQFALNKQGMHDNWTAPPSMVQLYTRQIAAADFDNDGFEDLIIAEATGQTWLLRSGEGRTFVDVTSDFGLPSQIPTGGANCLVSWLDVDNDGFQDLLLGPDLYHNIAGERFENMTAQSHLKIGVGPMSCAVADFDCDGHLDLYILFQHSKTRRPTGARGWVGDDDSGGENELWRNTGDGVFEEVAAARGVTGGLKHSFSAAWLHANDDHFPDLYVANDFAKNSLFLNNGDGSFRDVSEVSGTADFATSMGVAVGDINGDGQPEIYVANMYSKMGRRIIKHVDSGDYPPGVYEQIKGSCAGNRMYQLSGDGESWNEVSEKIGVNAVGWAHAPALADFNCDGLLDVYATAGFLSSVKGKPDG